MAEDEDLSRHKEVANAQARDDKGHFVHIKRSEDPEPAEGQKNPLTQFFSDHTHTSKAQDDLIDVHVGNPLRRITKLLEDIKKQKAFSFTLKGSLGIAGVALALGVFGIFGGGQILCDKGIQTQIGVVRQLQIQDQDSPVIPIFSQILSVVEWTPKQTHQRIILIKNDFSAINLIANNLTIQQFNNLNVIVTGKYDSCSETLTISDTKAVEVYPK